MKRIRVIELGGTISAEGKHRFDFKDYASGKFCGEDFLQTVPEINELADVTFETFLRVSSTEITPLHWLQLREKVQTYVASDTCDGIVITHGTNTLEETAYFLHLTVATEKPIVLVGAQRPFNVISTDAHLNLYQAVQVAAADESCGKGVLIVLNNTIHSAREATKTNTYRLEAFQSGTYGALGIVDTDGTVQYYRQPTRRHTFASEFAQLNMTELAEIAIVYSYAGATGFLIEQIVASKQYRGIVTAGTGAGLVAPSELAALQKALAAGLFVVRSQRVGHGRVVAIEPYADYSFIHGDDLSPQKARILLMVSLLKYDTVAEIQNIFNTY